MDMYSAVHMNPSINISHRTSVDLFTKLLNEKVSFFSLLKCHQKATRRIKIELIPSSALIHPEGEKNNELNCRAF